MAIGAFTPLRRAFPQDRIAIEIDLPDLVLESSAELKRFAKIFLLEIVGLQIIGRAHGCVARLVGEKRHLAENIARAESCNLALRLPGFYNRHTGTAARDQEELLADLSLADHDIARRVFALVHAVGDVSELGRGQILEQLDAAQKPDHRKRLAQNYVGYNVTVHHVHDTVGKLQDAVVMRYHHDGAAFVGGELLQ